MELPPGSHHSSRVSEYNHSPHLPTRDSITEQHGLYKPNQLHLKYVASRSYSDAITQATSFSTYSRIQTLSTFMASYVACLAPIIKNKTQVDSILHYVSLSIDIYKLLSAEVNSFSNTLYFALLQQTMNTVCTV